MSCLREGAVLVSKGLDSGVPVVVDGSLVGGLQSVREVHDSGREGGIGQARPSHPEACHLGSADDGKPGIELCSICWVAGGDGGDLSGGGRSSSYEGRGHMVPSYEGSYDGCGIAAKSNIRRKEHDVELGQAIISRLLLHGGHSQGRREKHDVMGPEFVCACCSTTVGTQA